MSAAPVRIVQTAPTRLHPDFVAVGDLVTRVYWASRLPGTVVSVERNGKRITFREDPCTTERAVVFDRPGHLHVANWSKAYQRYSLKGPSGTMLIEGHHEEIT